jgi:hypothetical protein
MLKYTGYRLAVFVLLALVGLLMTACPTPVPASVATTASGGNFTVTVNPVGPPKWTYTVKTTGSSNINFIEIIAPINIKDCKVTVPTGWTQAGNVLSTNTASATTVTYSLECDKTNGPTYVKVNDVAGSGPNSLGPVAGPT